MRKLFCLCALAICSQAYGVLPDQPRFVPAPPTDHGAYSVQLAGSAGTDPDLAKAYDNFTITGTYNLTGIEWSGIFAEPIPGAAGPDDSGTSVETIAWAVEIWGDDGGAPDLASGSLPGLEWVFQGGIVPGSSGLGGSPGGSQVISVTSNGDVSPATAATVGGGDGYDYVAEFDTVVLPPGDYWISIISEQTFNSPFPLVDPEWQWAFGSGGDGAFYEQDRTLGIDELATNGLDLAFKLNGTLVPEPSGLLLGLLGFGTLGLLRRKRG